MSTRFVVTACEGREAVTAACLKALTFEGGGHDLGHPITLHWASSDLYGTGDPPPFETWGMNVHRWYREPGESTRATYWRTLQMEHALAPNDDLVVIEDDVQPARNALLYIERWRSPHVTTFYNTRGYTTPGPRPVDFTGHWGSQCLYYPNAVLRQLVLHDPDSKQWLTNPSNPRMLHQGRHGADLILGFMLHAWGLNVYHHQSIVQHVGDVSLCDPTSKLKGIRVARDFVGVDFDCLKPGAFA